MEQGSGAGTFKERLNTAIASPGAGGEGQRGGGGERWGAHGIRKGCMLQHDGTKQDDLGSTTAGHWE